MTTAHEESSRLADLLRREHHALAEFLAALSAFDRERRWVDLGYKCLFYFLTRELGLSKGAAYYRKTAAELVQCYPEVLDALREGKLCLTSIVELSKVISSENRAEVLPRYFHLSKREAKEVTAEMLPATTPPFRTLVTSLPADAGPAHSLAASLVPVVVAAGSVVTDVRVTPSSGFPENLPHANSVVPGVAPAPVASPAQLASFDVEPLTAELRRLHLTVSKGLLAKLAAARDALSHSHPSASEETVIEVGLDLIVQRHAKRRGIGAKPRAASPKKLEGAAPVEPPTKERSRHVPSAVWRGVWERDHGCCAWPLENGGVCGSTRQVELDHVNGWSLGADTTIDECRLLCRFHQDVAARRLYGDDLMNNYTRPKGGTCSEPVAVYQAPAATCWLATPGWFRPPGRPCQSGRASGSVQARGGCPGPGALTTRTAPGHHAARTRVGSPAPRER